MANAATRLGALKGKARAAALDDEGDDQAPETEAGHPDAPPRAIAKPTFFASLREVAAQVAPDAPLSALPDFEVRAGGMRVLPAREWVLLFDRLARELDCPDLGLRAAQLECTLMDDNPFLLAQYHAETVGDAIGWAERASRVISRAFRIHCVAPAHAKWAVIEYDLLVGDPLRRRQAVEYGVAMILHRLTRIAGPPQACEVWFAHQPMSPRHVYAEHLPAKIQFGQACNAILVNRDYLGRAVPNRWPGILEVARYYIETHFPDGGFDLRAEAERVMARLLGEDRCGLGELAGELGLHPRTLQRRLREEGTSFFQVKDKAQRAQALALLQDKQLSVKQIAMRLGYSEGSGFTRSCLRWFSAGPRDVRAGLADAAAGTELD